MRRPNANGRPRKFWPAGPLKKTPVARIVVEATTSIAARASIDSVIRTLDRQIDLLDQKIRKLMTLRDGA